MIYIITLLVCIFVLLWKYTYIIRTTPFLTCLPRNTRFVAYIGIYGENFVKFYLDKTSLLLHISYTRVWSAMFGWLLFFLLFSSFLVEWLKNLSYLLVWVFLVLWYFLQFSEEFNAGFGSHTPMILGQAKVVRYFPNYER